MFTLGEISEEYVTEFSWSIEDFLSLPTETDTYYESPTFSFANGSWDLTIFPNGRKANISEGYIGLYLFKESNDPPITVDFTLGIKTVEGKLDFERHCKSNTGGTEGFGAPFFLRRTVLLERKSDLLPSDTLTLVCRMKQSEHIEIASLRDTITTRCSYCSKTLCDDEDIQAHLRKCEDLPIICQKCSNDVLLKNWFNHSCQKTEKEGVEIISKPSKVFPDNKVLQDFKELFLNQNQSDVLIKVKEREFTAHRSILAARSPVFESTFRNDMKEKETGVVNIEDCDPSSFSVFLCFLYCGQIENLSAENVISLYTTADKYDVQDLRDICVKFMKENLFVDTFCDTITLALQHCESDLIALATDFFTKNARKIVKTVQWQRFSTEKPTQSNELVIKAFDAAAGLND